MEVLLSADNRISPILAYSENAKFDLNSDDYPTGLVEWLTKTKEGIKSIRIENIKQSSFVKKEWDDLLTKAISESAKLKSSQDDRITISKVPLPSGCEDEHETVGPLTSTTWSQAGGFNDLMPLITCDGQPFQAYAGCVPVALAQIMKYHNYPSSYNWANMPNNYGTTETASLIKDIHDKYVINYYGQLISAVDYKCDGTGIDKDYDSSGVLRNGFNYSSASQSSYSTETLKNNLRQGRPVILKGGRKSGWWVFASYADGHMWVCDGFRRSKYWDEDCTMAWTYLYLRMNWGWGGLYDGWYAFDNFNPGTSTYNYDVKMISNINP